MLVYPLKAMHLMSAWARVATAVLLAATFLQDRGTDLVTVDVQVVDRDSTPVSILGKGDFEVTIDGRTRRVVSAEFISTSSAGVAPRAFFLAVDAGSFDASDSAAFVQAAKGFAAQLQPTDVVGVFTLLAQGPFLDPTLDRTELGRALDAMTGRRQDRVSQFNLSSSEVLDIVAESAQRGNITATSMMGRGTSPATPRGGAAPVALDTALQRVVIRECPGVGDVACRDAVVREAMVLAQQLEQRTDQSLSSLGTLLDALRDYPGRKIVVVLSGGMVMSERPGEGNAINLRTEKLSQQAAKSNTTVYALHVDVDVSQKYAARSRQPLSTAALARERTLSSKILNDVAAASGGSMFFDQVGSGDVAFGRIIRETSGYYLLGVEPAMSDRDGRAHKLSVKTNSRGATVRNRQWVVIAAR
jgi:VWFA-related protein